MSGMTSLQGYFAVLVFCLDLKRRADASASLASSHKLGRAVALAVGWSPTGPFLAINFTPVLGRGSHRAKRPARSDAIYDRMSEEIATPDGVAHIKTYTA